jgi:SAM-dependent methyltransferase
MWAAGVRIGLSPLRKAPLLGLKRLALLVSYWRTAEFTYVWKRLGYPPGARILDPGSPKDLAVLLARYRGYEVTATDILPEAVALSRRYATAQGLEGDGPGKVSCEVQDGRSLTYPDDSFDAAFSVSVLEHIPDHGDSEAMQELLRVVKPGSVVLVTTPYDTQYRETFVNRAVYEREQRDRQPVFYERHYDDAALQARLLSVPRAQLLDLEFWGEGAIRMETLMARLGPARLFLSPLEPFLSALCLRRIHRGDAGHPMAVFFTLQKQ